MTANVRLELLVPDHARPLERFERANRAFFAARVGDRGDDFFEHFDDRLAARVDENREGASLFFVIVDGAGEILGRVNISDIDHPELTELGFRVAGHVQGRGIATRGVITALDIAATRGVKAVKARVSTANLASLPCWNTAALTTRDRQRRQTVLQGPSSATARTSPARPVCQSLNTLDIG